MRFLHDDREPIVVTHLLDVTPSDVADVTESEACEATEEEGLLDEHVGAWSVDEPHDFVGMEECLDHNWTLWHFAASHMCDGIGWNGLLHYSFGEHALEGTEVVVGTDARDASAAVGACMLEILSESFADVECYFFHLQGVGTMTEVADKVVVHVAACTGVARPSVCFLASFDVVLHILAESHVGKGGVVVNARFSLGDLDDASCFDGVCCTKNVFVDDFGIWSGLWYEVKIEELIGSDAIGVDVKIDGEVAIRKLLESKSNRFFSVNLFVVCHSLFCPKIRKNITSE